jgi:DNA-binding HxlR family transcriptional regulator
MENGKINPESTPRVARMVEDIVGCKWSLAVLGLVRGGVRRPGAMEHSIDGLTAKVLNERLRKLMRYGILDKTVYAEVPPRVEYELTPFGRHFSGLLDQIDLLQKELDLGGTQSQDARQPTAQDT